MIIFLAHLMVSLKKRVLICREYEVFLTIIQSKRILPLQVDKQEMERRFSCHLNGYCWKQLGIIMPCNAGFSDQVVELDFLYLSEGIHKRWDNGYRITANAATLDQSALILSIPRNRLGDETQETLRTSQFSSAHVKEKWSKNLYLAHLCYRRTIC
ncbi:casein kinase 1-like protein HD16 [Vicia villosa]|uniref:casein kinase 1-like protein HD16 n=1 Tax=Vicia villosa TaxID=3911 RepID=UPI00273BF6E0|nr:casein kinase 1-like protein HD16 [Vicia villosa]XP_058748714.1 casein kinase 1-like protein HD16 [Vicia villosa]